MKRRYLVIGEIVLIGLLVVLLLLDFTGVGRRNRRKYNQIDHVSPAAEPGVVTVDPLGSDDSVIYHQVGDKLVPPTPTPTATPTPTPTLSPEQQMLKNAMDEAFDYTIPKNIAFADVEGYLSIRREPDGNAPRLGLMNPGDSCILEFVDGEWAYVRSGSVKGYCKANLLIMGEAAAQYAAEHVVYTATVTGNVNVRREPTTLEDNVITSLEIGAVVTAKTPAVISKNDSTTPLFIEIELKDGTIGYIASNKADITFSWPVGRVIDDRKEQ